MRAWARPVCCVSRCRHCRATSCGSRARRNRTTPGCSVPIRDAFAEHVGGWERVPDSSAGIVPRSMLCSRKEAIERPRPPTRRRALALADSILAILQHSLGARHALLIVDDLQWADSDVLAVLSRIVRSQMPCTTVVATRPLDREGDYLLQFFSDLRRTVETSTSSSPHSASPRSAISCAARSDWRRRASRSMCTSAPEGTRS